jgi:hypothetical protein
MPELRFRFDEVDQTIPSVKDMPLLKEWVEQVEKKRGRPLAGVTALLIQHQLANQVPQVEALIRLGLDPADIHWLDIPYTANRAVRRALLDLEIPDRNLRVHRYRVLEPYAPYQLRRTQELVRDFLADPPDRLLVLDDGAYFLDAAASFRRRLPRVAVVEQTTRGLIKIDSKAALRLYEREIPIVNVATSEPKQTLEPPFIGRAVCRSLREGMERNGFHLSPMDRCLLFGYGAIGEQVARFLVETCGCTPEQVHVADPKPGRQDEARARKHAIWNPSDLDSRYKLVVGASGVASFGIGDYVYLEPNALLASASSGSVELSRRDFIDLAVTSGIDDIAIDRQSLCEDEIHSDLAIDLVDRRAIFLNAGFPVNFDGRIQCVPSFYIQPTPTMMVQGSLQAVRAMDVGETGRLDLDSDFGNWLDQRFRELLGPDAQVLPERRVGRQPAGGEIE